MPEDGPTPARVVAAVLVEDPSRLGDAVLTVRLQSMEVERVVAVGGGGPARDEAATLDVEWVAEIGEVDPAADTTHLWFLRDDVEARPDALASLVDDGDRTEATVVGSKVLAADRRDRLVSIGGATDALCVPVPTLEEGELDQGQYDVIRDVAYIPSQSVLIRRDAFAGLGGLDRLLAPDAAGIDFSQRARIAGGRVVIAPSSEVFTTGRFAAELPAWREQAGQLRALLKTYSSISLLWALPLWLLVSVVTAVGWALLGRPAALADFVKAVAWNLKNAGSLVRARRRVGAARQVGDEELFRYQTTGSHGLAIWWEAVLAAVRRPLESGQEAMDRAESSGLGEGTLVWLALVLVWFVGARDVLADGLPFGAWTGALAEPRDVLSSWAGGWHPAAMGGDGPPHPAAALLAVAGLALGSSTATWGVALGSLVGIIGGLRLGRTLGLGRWPALVGALVGVLGPAVVAAGTDGGYQVVLGVAAAPWVADRLVAPLPEGRRALVGRVARLAIGTAVLGMAAPGALVLPLLVAVLAVVMLGRTSALVLAPIGILAALPALGPWLAWYDLGTLAGPDAGFWAPPIWLLAGFGVAWLVSVVAGGRWEAAAIGGVLAATGAVLSRGILPGREAWVAGFVVASVGLGLVAAGAVDRLVRPGRGRPAGVLASVGVVALGIPLAAALVGGNLGLAVDEAVADVVAYLDARGSEIQERAVLSGVEHPGSPSAGVDGRVLDPVAWSFDRAWVGADGAADDALAATLEDLEAVPVARPGAALAAHGVRWVVTPAGSPLDMSLSGRLDVFRLVTPEGVVFEAADPAPVAAGPAGPWQLGSRTFEGPPAGEVVAAINPTERWPSVATDDGRVVLSGGAGLLEVDPDETALVVARVAAGWFALVGLVAIWGRRSTS